jgi:hypothetical protein
MSDTEHSGPPATFESLARSLKMQAELHMGLLHFGDEKERPEPDFPIARYSIDLLAMLQEKTKGNLTLEEQRLIENTLTELRFRFVYAMEQSKKSAETKTAVSGESEEANSEGQAGE